ncbi:MAG: HAMP domain-containing sensor histidine kinase [Cystobacter sp.]
MKADGPELRALYRVKRNNYFVCAALLLVSAWIAGCSFLELDTRLPPLLLLWAASLVALGVGVRWIPTRISGVCTGVLCILLNTWSIHITGGLDSPFFPVLGAIPLLIAMFTPYAWWPALASAAAMMVTVVLLDLQAGLPMLKMVPQLMSLLVLDVAALFGSRTYRRLLDAREEAQQERVVALEQLAESERRRLLAERERAEVDRLVMVGMLAAGVAHEVNNPLSFVKSNLSYLDREVREGGVASNREELVEALTETREGVMRIEQIVTDLRAFSRREESTQEEGGLPSSALVEARRLASVRLGLVDMEMDVPPGLPPVRLGHRHLVQVMLNLLINAADAVELVTTSRRAHVRMDARCVDESVRVVVEDNGPGIPPEVLARLFEPFFTTKPPGKGTGLGLALCREYVTRVGGTLHAENRPEGGARFILMLPMCRERTCATA